MTEAPDGFLKIHHEMIKWILGVLVGICGLIFKIGIWYADSQNPRECVGETEVSDLRIQVLEEINKMHTKLALVEQSVTYTANQIANIQKELKEHVRDDRKKNSA